MLAALPCSDERLHGGREANCGSGGAAASCARLRGGRRLRCGRAGGAGADANSDAVPTSAGDATDPTLATAAAAAAFVGTAAGAAAAPASVGTDSVASATTGSVPMSSNSCCSESFSLEGTSSDEVSVAACLGRDPEEELIVPTSDVRPLPERDASGYDGPRLS